MVMLGYMRYNKAMFIVGLLGWWYGAGWRERVRMIGARLLRIFDYFSLDLLVKTWFSPFRQIGAGQVQGGLPEQLKAFGDRLVSRMIGAAVRTIMIIVGVIMLSVMAIAGLIESIIWMIIPLLPIIGAILFAIGWVPHAGI